jgi:PrtD family type I secretion system ABC transporter
MLKTLRLRPGHFLSAAVLITVGHVIYLSVPLYMMIVYDKVLYSFSRATLYTMGIGLLVALVALVLMEYLEKRLLAAAGNRLVEEAQMPVLRFMAVDAAGMAPTGYTRGLADLETVRDAAARGRFFVFFNLPWVILYLIVLVIIHPLVGGIAAAAVFLAALFQILLAVAEKKRYAAADVMDADSRKFAGQCLDQARLLAGMNMVPDLGGYYRRHSEKAEATRAGAEGLYAGTGRVIRLIHLAGPAAVFGAGAFVFFNEQITMGGILAGVVLSFYLFGFLEQRLADLPAAIAAGAAYRRLRTFVDIPPDENKLSLPEPAGKFDGQGLMLSLGGKPELFNISFDLVPGEMLGVVGPSASGKSILCRVLTGVWPLSGGKVLLEGAPISQWPEEDLARYMGYLPEEPLLLPVTVARNIARLKEPDSEKVVAAARKAGVHEMILTLSQGYDTPVEQTGANLSAGQRQGISLARALYDDPKVVIMDEPHNHLDDKGMQGLMDCMDRLREAGTTVVVVTDRPRILMKMDKLLMIKDGKSAMYGPAKEVLAQLSNRQQPPQGTGV